MRRAIAGAWLALAAGCTTSAAPSDHALAGAPAWLADATEIEVRDRARLAVGPLAPIAEATDDLPARPMAILDGRVWREPPAPVWSGRLTARGAVWVTTRGELVDGEGNSLARTVEPELAVSPDGASLAYVRSPGEPDEGVHLLSLAQGTSVHVSAGMAHAGRPIFASEDVLVVVGSGESGIAGVWTIDLRGARPRASAITNGDLRTGAPLGESFVPPPAFHESMRIEDGALVYDDGETVRRVPLPELAR